MKNLKTTTLLFSLVILSALAFYACKKKDNQQIAQTEHYQINFKLAKTSNELTTIRADKNANIIRTLSDFDRVLAKKQTPLSKLPKEIIDDFRSQLTVRENVGIVGIKYGTIIDLLNDDEFAETMGLFGLDTKNGFWGFSKNKDVVSKMSASTKLRDGSTQSIFFEDYMSYKCVSPHNCAMNADYICLSGC